MVAEVRTTRSYNTVWIVIAILVGVAVLAFAIMAAGGRDDGPAAPAITDPPTATVSNMGNAMAEGASDAARSAADATIVDARPAPGVTATVPGPGDSTITVTTPPAR